MRSAGWVNEMVAFEARLARLEQELAQLQLARSPARSWAALIAHAGTPVQVGRSCAPLRAQIEDQFLAYGWEARRMAEQGATWPEVFLGHPLGAFSALLSYRPDEDVPAKLLASVRPLEHDAQAWMMTAMGIGDGRYYYDVTYGQWLYSAVTAFISPDPTARQLRQRLYEPSFVPPALAIPKTIKFELWPAGLFDWLAHGFQDPSWWTILDKTGQPPPASFFEEHGDQDEDPHERSLDEDGANPKRREDRAARGHGVFQALWELLEDADMAPGPSDGQMTPGPEGP